MRGLRSRVELGGSRGPPRARSDMLVRHGLYSSYRLMICSVSKAGLRVSSGEAGVAPSRVSACACVAELGRWLRGHSRILSTCQRPLFGSACRIPKPDPYSLFVVFSEVSSPHVLIYILLRLFTN